MARILKETGLSIDTSNIKNVDLIFRVMTWQHIPLLPPKNATITKEKPISEINKFFEELVIEEEKEDDAYFIREDIEKTIGTTVKADHIRINFPPFFHYRLSKNDIPYVVGKSHWTGSLDSGQFCKTHGSLTDNLARMIMKLVEKYALKSNWRGYSYRQDMEGQAVLQLCQVALQFDESKSNNVFAFLTTIAHNSFLRILNIEKKNQTIRDDLLIKHNVAPSYSRSNKDSAFYDEEY